MRCQFKNKWGSCQHHVTSLNNEGNKQEHHVISRKQTGTYACSWVKLFKVVEESEQILAT